MPRRASGGDERPRPRRTPALPCPLPPRRSRGQETCRGAPGAATYDRGRGARLRGRARRRRAAVAAGRLSGARVRRRKKAAAAAPARAAVPAAAAPPSLPGNVRRRSGSCSIASRPRRSRAPQCRPPPRRRSRLPNCRSARAAVIKGRGGGARPRRRARCRRTAVSGRQLAAARERRPKRNRRLGARPRRRARRRRAAVAARQPAAAREQRQHSTAAAASARAAVPAAAAPPSPTADLPRRASGEGRRPRPRPPSSSSPPLAAPPPPAVRDTGAAQWAPPRLGTPQLPL